MAVSEHLIPEELPVKSALAVAVSTALTGYAHDATAQESGASSALEEIVVTSRKREESMQDIAGSIQAITGDQMRRQGLQNLEDLVRFLPNVSSLGTTAGETRSSSVVCRITPEHSSPLRRLLSISTNSHSRNFP